MLQMAKRSVPSDAISFGTNEKDYLEPLMDPIADDVPRRHVKAPHRTLPTVLLTFAAILLFVGGMVMIGRPYADPCEGFEFTVCGYTGCYTVTQFFGTLFAMFALPAVLIPIGLLPQVRPVPRFHSYLLKYFILNRFVDMLLIVVVCRALGAAVVVVCVLSPLWLQSLSLAPVCLLLTPLVIL